MLEAKWCSVCPFAATRKCARAQEGSGPNGEEHDGCGFYLCDGCYALLKKIHLG